MSFYRMIAVADDCSAGDELLVGAVDLELATPAPRADSADAFVVTDSCANAASHNISVAESAMVNAVFIVDSSVPERIAGFTIWCCRLDIARVGHRLPWQLMQIKQSVRSAAAFAPHQGAAGCCNTPTACWPSA